jgi:hypothetical protein
MNRSLFATVLVVSSIASAAPPPPDKLDLKPPPTPSGTVNLETLDSALGTQFNGIAIATSATNVSIGGYSTMGPTSTLNAKVFTIGGNGSAAPAGRYRVRFTFSNVGFASNLTLTSGSTTAPCALKALSGYRNYQSCDIVVTSTGQAFAASAGSLTGSSQLTFTSIQVFKET